MLPKSIVLPPTFFQRDPDRCAVDLIGAYLKHGRCGGKIVETEAYAAKGDEACHTFFRAKARQFVANHAAGTAYVYLNYGVYWLANVLTRSKSGEVGFVLIRALEPTAGISTMKRRRGREKLTELCSGPGKLTIALDINDRFHGTDLTTSRGPCFIHGEPASSIISGPRIGISREVERPWRFGMAGNPHLSKPFGRSS